MKVDDIKKNKYNYFYSYFESNLILFYKKIDDFLTRVKIQDIINEINPYLLRNKGFQTSGKIIESIIYKKIHDLENKIFDELLRDFSIFLCNNNSKVFTNENDFIDLDIEKNGVRYLISLDQYFDESDYSYLNLVINKFHNARKDIKHSSKKIRCILGLYYYNFRNKHFDNFVILSGTEYWRFISDNHQFYNEMLKIIDKNKIYNYENSDLFAQTVNKLTVNFIEKICDNNIINWEKLVKFNSSMKKNDL